MAKRDGRPQGAQEHAEGEHGDKTHSRFIETLHEGAPQSQQEPAGGATEGAHRLREDREQHDDAEKDSEKNRLARDK